jgi:hypothetical protein
MAFQSNNRLLAALPFFVLALCAGYAHADVQCVRATNKVTKGKVVTSLSTVTRATSCKKGEVALLQGPAGTAGDLRVYGDGSLGAKIFSSPETFSEATAMYTDVVINSGVTLIVPSGTVIRCTGSFVNNGTISVGNTGPSGVEIGTLAEGGLFLNADTSGVMPATIASHPGVSARAAMMGELGTSGTSRTPGLGGVGLSEYSARLIRYPGPLAGGGGAGGVVQAGPSGGGSLVVLCAGSVVNNGTIRADAINAGTGVGGGGGGIIILASQTSVTSTSGSSLLARGGRGGTSNSQTAAAGGGGGGIIHLMSPSINTVGASISVAGGPGGTSAGTAINSNPSTGGAGGGACGGNGGVGASVDIFNTGGTANAGSSGHALTSILDPTSLF